MDRKCAIAITCPGNPPGLNGDSPVSNYTAELPDTLDYEGFVYPIFDNNNTIGGTTTTGNFPPWIAAGCQSTCFSFLSFDDAQACAARQAFICAHTPPTGPAPTFFFNAQQSCPFTCPDGTVYVYTVLPGYFVALSQTEADSLAQNLACQRAVSDHVCLGSLTSEVCANAQYNSTMQLSGVYPLSVAVVSGQLPPGFVLSQDPAGKTATVSGTCTAPGNYQFALMATDPNGNFHIKSFTIGVVGVASTAPPNAMENTPYTFTFQGLGGSGPYSFSLISGTLPGITLSSSGTLSGTPNYVTAGSYPFTFTVADAAGTSCVINATLKVTLRPGPDWTKLQWSAYTLVQFPPNNTASGSAIQNTAFGSVISDGTNQPKISPVAAAGVTYTGPQVTAMIILTVSNSAPFSSMACRIFRNGVQIESYGQAFASGTYQMQFTVPLSVGAVFTVDDASPGNSWAAVFGGAAGTLSFTWAIVNV